MNKNLTELNKLSNQYDNAEKKVNVLKKKLNANKNGNNVSSIKAEIITYKDRMKQLKQDIFNISEQLLDENLNRLQTNYNTHIKQQIDFKRVVPFGLRRVLNGKSVFPRNAYNKYTRSALNYGKPYAQIKRHLERELKGQMSNWPLLTNATPKQVIESYWSPNSWIRKPTTKAHRTIRKKVEKKFKELQNTNSGNAIHNGIVELSQLPNSKAVSHRMTTMGRYARFLERNKGDATVWFSRHRYPQTVNIRPKKTKPNDNKTGRKTNVKRINKIKKNVGASNVARMGSIKLTRPLHVKNRKGQNFGGLTKNVYSNMYDEVIKSGTLKKFNKNPDAYYTLNKSKNAVALGALVAKVLRGSEPEVRTWPLSLDPSLFISPNVLNGPEMNSDGTPEHYAQLLEFTRPEIAKENT